MKPNLKTCFFLSILLFHAILGGCAAPPDLINQERLVGIKSVAVLPFEDAPGAYGRRSGTAVCGFITGELARSKRFRIVERSRLKSIMNEQNLQAADLVDEDTAVKVGRMLGVHGVLVGSVSQYDMDKTTVYVYVVPVVSKDYKVGATVRLIDVSNGEVIYANSACGSSGNNFTEAGKQAAQNMLAALVNLSSPP